MSKSSTIMADPDLLPNPTPGEVLLEDFLKPMGLSQNELARALRVPPRRINEIVLGKRSISADTDLRLARYFSVSEGVFLGLQADFDLMRKRRQIQAVLDAIEPRAACFATIPHNLTAARAANACVLEFQLAGLDDFFRETGIRECLPAEADQAHRTISK